MSLPCWIFKSSSRYSANTNWGTQNWTIGLLKLVNRLNKRLVKLPYRSLRMMENMPLLPHSKSEFPWNLRERFCWRQSSCRICAWELADIRFSQNLHTRSTSEFQNLRKTVVWCFLTSPCLLPVCWLILQLEERICDHWSISDIFPNISNFFGKVACGGSPNPVVAAVV